VPDCGAGQGVAISDRHRHYARQQRDGLLLGLVLAVGHRELSRVLPALVRLAQRRPASSGIQRRTGIIRVATGSLPCVLRRCPQYLQRYESKSWS